MSFFKKIFKKQKPIEIDEPAPEDRQPENKPNDKKSGKPWIGVDLDGTLAQDGPWVADYQIGPPVPLMFARVKNWLKLGMEVKIMTARAADPEHIPAVKKWLTDNGLPELDVTNAKDFNMIELWDDRAIQIVQNTGRPFLTPSIFGRPRAPILPDEASTHTFYSPIPPKKEEPKADGTDKES